MLYNIKCYQNGRKSEGKQKTANNLLTFDSKSKDIYLKLIGFNVQNF